MLNFFRRQRRAPAPASIGGDLRVYAIGDIHGRLDLLDQLLKLIEQDDTARAPMRRQLILLGDLVDRGPCSRQVVERAMELTDARFIKGNHEELFIAAARGSAQHVGYFRKIGGIETLASYGLTPEDNAAMKDRDLAQWMLNHVPRAHIDFLDGFSDYLNIDDYLFVHAGIKPRIALEAQDTADLRWIRGKFLRYRGDHGHMVVHGHSITAEVEQRPNRIGIDTGAWKSGRLTAMGLEGTERWFVQTAADNESAAF